MIIVNQVKLRPGYSLEALKNKIAAILHVDVSNILSVQIDKESIDARKKQELFFVLNVICEVKNETAILKKNRDKNVSLYNPVSYSFVELGSANLKHRPVIIGAGPAGLFAALYLAKYGYKPIVLERGYDVDKRSSDIESFWVSGTLNPESNVLFGEGGAGTFSDGKLNTLVKDKSGRNKEVLRTFVSFGAKEEILYENKPHVGTDELRKIIKNLRNDIVLNGGEVRFGSKVTDFFFDGNKISGVLINNNERIDTDICVLAIGHSARDTFAKLYDRKFYLEQKDFAVGFRIEHKQDMINSELLTDDPNIMRYLKPAAYKLAYKAENGRGVYSFCMCPGGYVVNASSEDERLCINGMSYSKRDGENANSAIVVSVGKEDFESEHPLAGIEYQRKIEANAYKAGQGKIPVTRFGEFKKHFYPEYIPEAVSEVTPNMKGQYIFADLSNVLSKDLSLTLIEGIDYFERIIKGFSRDDALLSAVESRTSSPVRITRDDDFESLNYKGVYPCGEGAGYAGGITSAAMDGMKIAEKIASIYAPLDM